MTDLSIKYRPPGPLKIDGNFKLEDWQKWLKSYKWYAGAANLSKKSPDEQLSILKGIMGPEALDIWGNFSVCETSDVESVLKKFEEHFTPKMNVPLERLNFNRLVQCPGQSFDDFLDAAINQVDKCNFGDMRDDFLRDKIVAGIVDDDLRNKLLAEEDLTFHKAVKICRASAKDHFMSVLEVGRLEVRKEETEQEEALDVETPEEPAADAEEQPEMRAVRPDRRCRQKRPQANSDRFEDEKPYACQISSCSFRTHHQKSLDRHMKIHKGEKRHACTICNYKSAVLSNVRDHMKTHSGEKPFECHHCGFRCALKGYIRNHLKIHIGDRPFACDMCEYKSNRLESLNRHKLRHTGEKPFACEICTFRCSQRSSMKIHMRGHTGEKPHACDECEYRSIVPEKLRIHKMRCHTGEKPYACDFCDMGFADAGSLRTHRRTHTGERPYTCDVCGYKCALRGNLRKHMMRHTGEKPYACHICEYRSVQQGSLKTHLKTHTGEKPNVCDICGHRCAHKGNLKKHMLTHTGERPFACPICPYRSAQSSGLKTHMKTHTGEKPYVCDICGFRCAHNGNLKQHMKTHKNPVPEVAGPIAGNLWSENPQGMNSSEYVRHTVFSVLDNNLNDGRGVSDSVGGSANHVDGLHGATSARVAHEAAHTGPNAHSVPNSVHAMSNSMVPMCDSHNITANAMHGMLHPSSAGHAHSVRQEPAALPPCLARSDHVANLASSDRPIRFANTTNHSPFHHPYAGCPSGHGQPT